MDQPSAVSGGSQTSTGQPALITVRWADEHVPAGYKTLKRGLDVSICLLTLALGLPLWILLALGIKLTSPGSVFYRSEVVGLGGVPFRYYKFRTMEAKADDRIHRQWLEQFVKNDAPFATDEAGQEVYKVVDDPRITPLGRLLRKFSLDEVPQMINVLRGDMSLVGPRPPVLYEYDHYDSWAKQRLSVLPGITGLYQVTGRSQVGFRQMVEIDLDYIRRRSIWLDLWIILKTPIVMLTARGAG